MHPHLNCCHTSRYCNQKYFNLMLFGGCNSKALMTLSDVSCVDACKLGDIEAYPPMNTKRLFPIVVYLKDDIYVFMA